MTQGVFLKSCMKVQCRARCCLYPLAFSVFVWISWLCIEKVQKDDAIYKAPSKSVRAPDSIVKYDKDVLLRTKYQRTNKQAFFQTTATDMAFQNYDLNMKNALNWNYRVAKKSKAFLGCFSAPSDTNFHVLQNSSNSVGSEECTAECGVNGFHLAAVQIYSHLCYCSNFTSTLPNLHREKNIKCEPTCKAGIFCGEEQNVLLYKTNTTELQTACGRISLSKPGTWKPIALTSFPGSGNTWTRHILQYATGHFTGSVYQDINIYLGGHIGEFEHHTSGTTIVIKTHRYLPNCTGAILLIRNPFDAIISYFKFFVTKSHVYGIERTNWPTNVWRTFAGNQIKKWSDLVFRWLMDGPETLVVYYENVINDPKTEIQKIVQFVKGDFTSEDRLQCTVKWQEGLFHRKKKTTLDHYANQMQDCIERHITAVAIALQVYQKDPLPTNYNSKVEPGQKWPLLESEMTNIAKKFTKDKNYISWKKRVQVL